MKILFVILEESAKQNLQSILNHNFFKKNSEKVNIFGLNLNYNNIKNVSNISVIPIMGITAILKNIFYLFRLRTNLNNIISNNNYSHVFFIDSFDFTKFYLKKFKVPNLKYCQIIGPSVYIWKKNKAIFINDNIDQLFSIFKIESEYYKSSVYTYIGHPILNKIIKSSCNSISIKNIGIFLGSRHQEINNNIYIIKDLLLKINQNSNYNMHIFITHSFEHFVKNEFKDLNNIKFHLNDNDYYNKISTLDFAFACSGTVHLELCFSNIPHFIFYKANYLNFFIFKYFVKSKYLSLLNIFSKKLIVKEFIQKDFNSNNLYENFNILCNNNDKYSNYNSKIQFALKKIKFSNLDNQLIIDYLERSSLAIKD